MKKLLILFSLLLCFTACEKKEPASIDLKDNLEKITALDKQSMFMNHGQNYRWFESCIKLNNFLDEENDGSIAEVVNVFQAIIEIDSTSFDTQVIKFQHFSNGTNVNDSIIGFWVEDEPMEDIKITFAEAYDKLMATNYPKPHSRYCTLRKQVGPIEANPQYIFGNIREQLYVDAITGEVSNVNPAFGFTNDSIILGCPLGEWP